MFEIESASDTATDATVCPLVCNVKYLLECLSYELCPGTTVTCPLSILLLTGKDKAILPEALALPEEESLVPAKDAARPLQVPAQEEVLMEELVQEYRDHHHAQAHRLGHRIRRHCEEQGWEGASPAAAAGVFFTRCADTGQCIRTDI